ncbi:DUF6362 family protein [Rhodopila sp.]|uniref:DUF6362 family protein n=1 Tax=Rhodopila sp. TaxID=2480087 RepID=UPI003D0DBF49
MICDVSNIIYDANYVTATLEAAGKTLLALPGCGFSPGLSAGGLDVVRNAIEAYGWTELPIRPPVPRARAISEMDQALRWLSLIPNDRYVLRRIVGARLLVHPVTDRHLFTWRRVGKVLGCDYRAIQRWHAEAIDLIVRALHARNNFQWGCSS